MGSKIFMEDLLKMLPEQVTNDILKKNFKCIELESGNYSIDIHDLKNNKVETVDGLNNMETQIMLLSASSALWKLAKDKKLDKVVYFSIFKVDGASREHISDYIPHILSFNSWMKSTLVKRLVDTHKVNKALSFLGLPDNELEKFTASAIKNRDQSINRIKIGMQSKGDKLDDTDDTDEFSESEDSLTFNEGTVFQV